MGSSVFKAELRLPSGQGPQKGETERGDLRKGGRERLRANAHVHLFVQLLAALDDCEPSNERAALVVRERERLSVADPQMDAAPAGVDPEEVFVPELVAECAVEHAHGGGDVRPAASADVGAGAAGADGVIVGHVDVEDELAELGGEGGGADGLLVSWLEGNSTLGDKQQMFCKEPRTTGRG